METKGQLIKEFERIIPFIESLAGLDDKIWTSPLEEGKWSVCDIVAHIMLWDKYYMEEGVEKVAAGQKLTIQHLDFDGFNRRAIDYAKRKSMTDLIAETIYYRKEILKYLDIIPEEKYEVEHLLPDGSKFVVSQYIKEFVWHDNHHRSQIESLIRFDFSNQESGEGR